MYSSRIQVIAAVIGGLAGARYGLDAIPSCWTEPLRVPLRATATACCGFQTSSASQRPYDLNCVRIRVHANADGGW